MRKYGRWTNVRSYAEGGQGHVFLVNNEEEGEARDYVLKRLKNPDRLDRFEAEISALRSLDSPLVVSIIDYSLESPFYYVMPLYEAGHLKHKVLVSDDEFVEALNFFAKICDATALANSKGIVHRDIKPENILLDKGEPVLSDFGICYTNNPEGNRTLIREAVGSRHYTAPELERGGGEVSNLADSYSLGKLLYWIFSRDGVTTPREEFRRNMDLRVPSQLGWFQFPQLEHVNAVLERSICENRGDRVSPAELADIARRQARLIQGRYVPIRNGDPIMCRFCGKDHYRPLPSDAASVRNFGLSPSGTNELTIYICAHCGNVQLFKTDDPHVRTNWGLPGGRN